MRTNEKDKENNVFLVGFTPSPFILFADILVADEPAFCSWLLSFHNREPKNYEANPPPPPTPRLLRVERWSANVTLRLININNTISQHFYLQILF